MSQSTINPAQLKITRSDDERVKSEHELKTVLPAEGAESITKYLSCNSCRSRIEEKDKKGFEMCRMWSISTQAEMLLEDLCQGYLRNR